MRSLHKIITIILSAVLACNAVLIPVFSQNGQTDPIPTEINQTNGASAEFLCRPDNYSMNQDYCVSLGPSEKLTKLAAEGRSGAKVPFNPQKIDPSLSTVPYNYAKLNLENTESAPLYNTVEDAIAGINAIGEIPAGGIRYVSYINRVDTADGHYVQAKNGSWLRASPAAVPTATLGRTFTATPSNNFGWVFEGCNPYLEPNYNSGVNTSVWFDREQVLEVLETTQDKNTAWFKVGENQWLDRNHFRCAYINTTPPEGVTNGRWIEVDLHEQVVMAYENNSLVFAAMVATGMKPFYTKPGIFQIYEKKEAENMTGAFEADKSDYYSLDDVPFTMYFDEARALHGAYWRAWYGYEQSHGCVNMTIGDAHWLYNWAQIGDTVYVHDPSGETPTDPSYYGAGGA
ncbi:MAG TPA: L,D-transpeptidase [Flexilinea sp.]|nr:L,D-transpeptidase [Flexilinea sp.]